MSEAIDALWARLAQHAQHIGDEHPGDWDASSLNAAVRQRLPLAAGVRLRRLREMADWRVAGLRSQLLQLTRGKAFRGVARYWQERQIQHG